MQLIHQSNIVKRAEILSKLEEHQEQLKQLGVKSLYLFGSIARDEATQESDADFLVEVERPAGFLKFSRIERYLEQQLGCPVDLGTQESLREHCRQPVFKDLIRIF